MDATDSDGPAASEQVFPPWGTLAIERYLLQKWNESSVEDAHAQRKRLVKEYVHEGQRMDAIQSASAPTPTQVSQILQPLRTRQQRHIAAHPGSLGTVWVRTCYAIGSDEQHANLIADMELYNTINGPAYLLSDPSLYDFGPDWTQILDVFPELVGLPDRDAQLAHDAYIQAAIAAFHAASSALAASDHSTIPNGPRAFIQRAREYLPAEEVRAHVLSAMQLSIHKACVTNFLFVEDAVALETGELRLLFLDARGRIVRETRVDQDAAQDMGGQWIQSSWDDLDEWIEAQWGECYREGGVEQKLLLFRRVETRDDHV